MPKTILNEEIYDKKKGGRQRKRWIADVEEDLRKTSIRGWRVKNENGQMEDCAGDQGPYLTAAPHR
jgi:hypothetical protein